MLPKRIDERSRTSEKRGGLSIPHETSGRRQWHSDFLWRQRAPDGWTMGSTP